MLDGLVDKTQKRDVTIVKQYMYSTTIIKTEVIKTIEVGHG